MLGTAASAFGGTLIGLTFYLHGLFLTEAQPKNQHLAIGLGFVAGVVGSVVDSVLGATVQVTWYDVEMKKIVNYQSKRICGRNWLSNESVNVVSVFLTTILAGVLGSWMFPVG